MIYIFILERINVAIIETGIGEERDSINVFKKPVMTSITTVDLDDHIETLGNNIKEIVCHGTRQESSNKNLYKRVNEIHT